MKGTRTEVHLRCLRMVGGMDTRLWRQEWPSNCQCTVNGISVDLKHVKRNDNNSICLFLNITPYLRNGDGAKNFVAFGVDTADITSYLRKIYVLLAQRVVAMQNGPITTSVYNEVELHWNHIKKVKILQNRYPNTNENILAN